MEDPKVKIRLFRASDDRASAEKFIEGHQRVLLAHGVTKVTSLNVEWMDNPAVFVINVESLDGEKVYGGARLHMAGGTQLLPVEMATGYMDDKIYDIVDEKAIEGACELCGLWNSIEVAGLGIGSYFPVRAGVAISSLLGAKYIFALCAPYTVSIAERVGFTLLDKVGNKGTFYYPKLDLIATAVILEDTTSLSTAKPMERKRMLELKNEPNQFAMERLPGKRTEVGIQYEMKLDGIDPNEFRKPRERS